MGWFKKNLPYSKEVLQFLHERIGSDTLEPANRVPLHSVLYMGKELYIDTIGFSNPETGESSGPLLYLSGAFESPVGKLEPPYAWMPLVWVILRRKLLPNAYAMFGPTIPVIIEDSEHRYETTLGVLLHIVENDFFKYWEQ